jgi:hypothetical protein
MAGNPKPLARSGDLIIEEVEEEVLVYDQNSDAAHCLSAEAARVWRACDGQTTIDALTADLGLDADTVTRALGELQSRNLLEAGQSGAALTRRDLTVKVAKVSAAAAAVPLIVSVRPPVAEAMMTPTPEQCAEYNAQSCNACCQIDGCCCCCQGSGTVNHDPGCKLCFPTSLCDPMTFTCPDAMEPVFTANCSCEGGDFPVGTPCEDLGVMDCGCTY